MNTTTAITVPSPAPPAPTAPGYEDLVRDFLAGRNEQTRRAYARDLEDFRAFIGARSMATGVHRLLAHGAGQGNSLALRYRNALVERGLLPSTISRRLAALRSVTRLARTLGMVGWKIEIKGPKVQVFRDTAGPGLQGIRAMLSAIPGDTPKALRDRALVRILHDLGLRRAEAVSLDLSHLKKGTISVLRKGQAQRRPVTVPPETRATLNEWIQARGPAPGPLFTSLDNRSKGHRLTVDGIYYIVRSIGKRAGLGKVTPHGLRHSSVTTGLNLSGGNVRAVAKFAGHANPGTTLRYDDNRQDLAGKIAKQIAAAV